MNRLLERAQQGAHGVRLGDVRPVLSCPPCQLLFRFGSPTPLPPMRVWPTDLYGAVDIASLGLALAVDEGLRPVRDGAAFHLVVLEVHGLH